MTTASTATGSPTRSIVTPQSSSSSSPPLPPLCDVCQDSIHAERVRVDKLYTLRGCLHTFHGSCIRSWLSYTAPTCPTCRRAVDVRECRAFYESGLVSWDECVMLVRFVLNFAPPPQTNATLSSSCNALVALAGPMATRLTHAIGVGTLIRGGGSGSRDTRPPTTCVLCQRPTGPGDGGLFALPCAHVFHAQCMYEWTSPQRGGRRCPVCSAALSTEMIEVARTRVNRHDGWLADALAVTSAIATYLLQ